MFPLIYEELRSIAARQLWNEREGHTLSPTALVHEADLRLIEYNRTERTGRSHFVPCEPTRAPNAAFGVFA